MDKEWHSFGNKSLATASAIRHFHPPMGKDWVCDNLCFKKKANYDSIRTEEPFNWDCYKKKASTCFMLQVLFGLWQKLTDMTKMSLANTPGIPSSQDLKEASIPTAGIHVLLLSDASRESHSLDSTKSHNWIPCFVTSSHLSPHPFSILSQYFSAENFIVLTGYLQDCWLNN